MDRTLRRLSLNGAKVISTAPDLYSVMVSTSFEVGGVGEIISSNLHFNPLVISSCLSVLGTEALTFSGILSLWCII